MKINSALKPMSEALAYLNKLLINTQTASLTAPTPSPRLVVIRLLVRLTLFGLSSLLLLMVVMISFSSETNKSCWISMRCLFCHFGFELWMYIKVHVMRMSVVNSVFSPACIRHVGSMQLQCRYPFDVGVDRVQNLWCGHRPYPTTPSYHVGFDFWLGIIILYF